MRSLWHDDPARRMGMARTHRPPHLRRRALPFSGCAMRDFDARSLIRPDLLELPGYVPIDPTDVLARRLGIDPAAVLKLDGNENPYGPSPKALDAIRAETAYHIYPDPDQRAAREAIARYTGAAVDQIVCGLGSDDLIDLLLRVVIRPGDAVINCPPTFGMYPFSTEIAGGRVIDIPRQESFSLDVAAIEKAAPTAKAIFLASPNNPTGNLLSPQEIERLLALPMLVVIDEAYIEFAGREHSSVALVASNPNLVVLRTFSKWAGLAGLRAGYGVMAPALAGVLMTIKQPYNLNVAASTAVVAAIDDRELLDERACRITGTRDRLMEALAAIPWLTPYPSDANFILCRLDGLDAVEVKERLAKRGIFVRYFDTPTLRNHLRISVGLEEHVDIIAAALREIGAELGR
jgi:histidinol-phosphate aminotransferase